MTLTLRCYGDLHLGPSDPDHDWERPDLDSDEYDAVVCIGDVIDDNIDHTSTVSEGQPYEERGRTFFEYLSGKGVPVLAVPGNHDQNLVEALGDAGSADDEIEKLTGEDFFRVLEAA